MDTLDVFSSKAEKYARYRWDYAPQAVQAIFEVTGIASQSWVADIGAGTGILTRHFTGRVGRIFAVEPNAGMRRMAMRTLGSHPSCQIIAGCAEATALANGCIDLITAAQAISWFDPLPARAEFWRILKPGGWLAVLRNLDTHAELGAALEKIYPAESDQEALRKGKGIPLSFYYGGAEFLRQSFPFTTRNTWEEFLGSLSTASYAPDEDSPWYTAFERDARRVFERFSREGWVTSQAVTELCLGQIQDL